MSDLRTTRSKTAESLVSLELQKAWYDRRTTSFKKNAQWISLLTISCGALTTLVPIFKSVLPGNLPEYMVAILGMIVVITQGILRIWRWDQIWPQYRIASERMKREKRLYEYNAGPYPDLRNEQAACRHYVESLEEIISEEQKIYWRNTRHAEEHHNHGNNYVT